MGIGTQAAWFALGSGALLAIVSGIFALRGFGLTRRTEIDKMYMAELSSVRAERDTAKKVINEKDALIDAKDTIIQELREQHLRDLPCYEREINLQTRVLELTNRVEELTDKFIGS